jgi:hypothetical protein
MNFAMTALVGLSLAQPPAADYFPMGTRTIKLPIDYKKDRKQIGLVQLYVARNGENMWAQEAEVYPDRDAFVFTAKDDGIYWFQIVTIDRQGRKDPPDVTKEAPALKVVVDTVKPAVAFTNVRRTGEEVVVEWEVKDKYPDESGTRVYFRAAGAAESYWQEVTLPAGSRHGVRFPSGTSGPVVVRVVAKDLAGNVGEGLRDVPAPGGVNQVSTSMLPPNVAAPAMPPAVSPTLPPPESLAPTGPLGPAAPVAPPVTPVVTQPFAPPVNPNPTVPVAPGSGQPIASGQGVPTSPPAEPRHPVVAAGPTAPPVAGPNVLATGSGNPAVAAAGVETTRAQVIGFPQFNLSYEVEQRGPSGISRVDLWVTRDDGRTWLKWSQHDGRESPLPVRVALDVRGNTQLEGLYGFRLVAVSGAGLSDPPPMSGDAPDLRVVLDVTHPVVKIFEPTSDPAQRDTLVIQWEAADRNFGDDPITLEWSEGPAGPWRPVATSGNEGVVPATAVGGAAARRVANTGRYPWRVPMGLPAKVYLKVTARDAAGNTTEVVTPTPILIDLSKPRAKITGIGAMTPIQR